jgi:hypothetical protein
MLGRPDPRFVSHWWRCSSLAVERVCRRAAVVLWRVPRAANLAQAPARFRSSWSRMPGLHRSCPHWRPPRLLLMWRSTSSLEWPWHASLVPLVDGLAHKRTVRDSPLNTNQYRRRWYMALVYGHMTCTQLTRRPHGFDTVAYTQVVSPASGFPAQRGFRMPAKGACPCRSPRG